MKINHVAMYVQDLEASKKFYETYFNATSNEMYHNPKTGLKTYFLSFDSKTRLEIMQRPKMMVRPEDLQLTGLIHLAFNVGSKERVDSLTQTLVQDGFKLISGPRLTGDGYYESCILDPEGNQIELTI